MLNKKPIFIVAFARGGSNILLNLLRSHPLVCSPRGELQEVFKGKRKDQLGVRLDKIAKYLPIVLKEKSDVFNLNSWRQRNNFSEFSEKKIDRVLFHDKTKALDPGQNLFKSENEYYAIEEIRSSRILCKNLNGLIFLTPQLQRMYPDATFIALVRNGLAVIEGHIRRGFKLDEFANNYKLGIEQIISDAQTYSNYHIFKYEDFMKKPMESLEKLFKVTDLDINQIKKIRMQTKRVIGSDGKHQLTQGIEDKELLWYDINEYFHHFVQDANNNQIKALSEEQRNRIVAICEASLRHFDYL